MSSQYTKPAENSRNGRTLWFTKIITYPLRVNLLRCKVEVISRETYTFDLHIWLCRARGYAFSVWIVILLSDNQISNEHVSPPSQPRFPLRAQSIACNKLFKVNAL